MKKILFINTAPYLAGSLLSDLKLAKLLQKNGFDVYFSTILENVKKEFNELKFIDFNEVLKKAKNFDIIFLTESKARNLLILIKFLNPKAKIFSVRRVLPKSTKLSILIQNLFSEKILCVSEDIAKRISSKKTFVIYSFVDKINGIKSSLNNPIVFGYLGRNDYDKGTDILLQAYKIKKFKLVLAGYFENSEFLKYDVEYLGFIKDKKMFFDKEVILESFSFGVPVIASNVGGIPEIVKENYNGFLFESENVNQLIEKIEFIEKNPKIILEISKNCVKTIEEKFLPEHMLERILKVINY